ncbi:MAG: phenylalanine--tRNA ligase subunit alpha [Alphaproteobacteria bacterium]|nr:phenylalanine--tRNA ligase subunit alpha [Alphaproteobacteria bacterium]
MSQPATKPSTSATPGAIETEALSAIASCTDLIALDAIRVAYLGKKGAITQQLKTLGAATPEERRSRGQALNAARDTITQAIEAQHDRLNLAEINSRLEAERLDVTLAPRHEAAGRIHPITQVIDEITAIFSAQGFATATGPEIEDDFHNFTALNIPESHPARQMHDTFYLQGEEGKPMPVLRTHTSPVQIRSMREGKPPFRLIAPGSTFRSDSDITHTPMFHQIEGLVIDKDIHMGHLKGCLINFIKEFFGLDDVPVRFRASFFPFTEPSAEVDIGCSRENGELKIGAGKDWLEILGCGMVHPNVLRNCGIDPDEWQGFAFGVGVERMAMLKYGIPDLRTFFDSDVRWLEHYGFAPLDIPALVSAYSSAYKK